MRTRRALLVWRVAAAAAICPGVTTSEAGPVTGSVTVRTADGSRPSPVVVYAEPVERSAPRQPGRFVLEQKDRTFRPGLLVVPVGSTIEFPNRDLIFHNVFSLSPPQPFDLGLYRGGASKSVTFAQPGAYRVFCNIHPEMTAVVAVVATPWIARADGEGRFALELPPGRYRLTALSERADPSSVELAVAADPATAPPIALDESRFVRVPHKNKYGQDYPAAAYGGTRR